MKTPRWFEATPPTSMRSIANTVMRWVERGNVTHCLVTLPMTDEGLKVLALAVATPEINWWLVMDCRQPLVSCALDGITATTHPHIHMGIEVGRSTDLFPAPLVPAYNTFAFVRYAQWEPIVNLDEWLLPTDNHPSHGIVATDSLVDAVIVQGGEFPMHPDWLRSLRDQCQEAAIPFFFLGWGDYVPAEQVVTRRSPIRSYSQTYPIKRVGGVRPWGDAPSETDALMVRVGRSNRGIPMLDDQTYLP
jgi:hypothetical protein